MNPGKLVVIAILLLAQELFAQGDKCTICGKDFGSTVYVFTDKVTSEKKRICAECSLLKEICFVCGLPVRADFTKLPDDRILCQRDVKNAILDDDEARQICEDTRDAMERLFSRFLDLPHTNLTIAVVDRVSLLDLFKMPGNDYSCPNVLGYIQSKTNRTSVKHEISLLGGLPRGEFKAVCAHELSHAWVYDNVPTNRRKTLGHDAHEGFCELLAYLLMDSEGDEDEKKAILRNAYTRGQSKLFIEAEQTYGLNDILDWMKYGNDSQLHGDDLNRVRNITAPVRRSPIPVLKEPAVVRRPAAPAGTIVLNGIVWDKARPLALINGRTFAPKEEGKVRVGDASVLIRCLDIQEDGVKITVGNSAQERELKVKRN